MTALVETLKRFYEQGRGGVDLQKLEQMFTDEVITQEEFDYITQ